MEIRQLRYFISAATHLNFTKAAKECFIVQSSMTEQIANLEDELGVKLFDRQRKGLTLTEAGEFFLPRAKAILAEAQKTKDEMALFRGGYRSYLRIGYHGELFKETLIQVLRTYRQELPEVKLSLRQLPENELAEGLRDGQLDVVLSIFGDGMKEETGWMETKPILKMGPVLAVARDHPLAERESITMEELRELSFAILEETGRGELISNIGLLETGAQREGQSLDPCSNEILIASGYGVNLWAEGLSRTGRYPNLHFVKIPDYPAAKEFVLAWRRGKLAPEGERFCQLVCEQIKGDG